VTEGVSQTLQASDKHARSEELIYLLNWTNKQISFHIAECLVVQKNYSFCLKYLSFPTNLFKSALLYYYILVQGLQTAAPSIDKYKDLRCLNFVHKYKKFLVSNQELAWLL
jgi:hypothetical protein